MNHSEFSVQSPSKATTVIWRIGFAFYLSAFVYGFLFLHMLEDRNRVFSQIWDLGHVAAYLSLVFFLYKLSPGFRTLSWGIQLAVMVAVAIVIGLIVEIIQSYTGRSFSLADIYLNVVGSVTGIVLFSNWSRYCSVAMRWLLRGLVVILIMLTAKNLIVYTLDAYDAHRQFPDLLNADSPFVLTRLSSGSVRLSKGRHENTDIIEAQFQPARYSTLVMDHFPRNWSGYQALVLRLYNAAPETITIHLRIHDIQHFEHNTAYSDRFNAGYPLAPGWNELRITMAQLEQAPTTRMMDLQHIHQLMLFFIDLSIPRTLLIGRIALE